MYNTNFYFIHDLKLSETILNCNVYKMLAITEYNLSIL